MIVGYQPGGTIKDARIVLRPDEPLPNHFNEYGPVVYRENPDDPKEWILVKQRDQILPADSPLLSKPESVHTDIKDFTEEKDAVFGHRDIIQFEE